MSSFIPGLGKEQNGARIGVLLANLGTPEAPTRSAVRRYLKEFLWDPRVVEFPRALWWFVLNGIILNTRPSKSAKAYQEVWTAQGSPLLLISQQQQQKLQQMLDKLAPGKYIVELGMRYGEPSLERAMTALAEHNARQIVVLPLYPQYSATTTASITDGLFDILKQWRVIPELRIVTQYYQQPAYLDAVAGSVEDYWKANGRCDKLLFSFHSIPKSYDDNGDVYRNHCVETAQAVAHRLGLNEEQWQISFQSRLGNKEWLRPYTDETLIALGKANTGRVDVVCPGFSADCLETLEEIDQENREYYLENGGAEYHYIPALNDNDSHIAMMQSLVESNSFGW